MRKRSLAECRFPPPPLLRNLVGLLANASRTLNLLNDLHLLWPLPANHPALALVEGEDPLEETAETAAGEPLLARYYLRKLEWPNAAAFSGCLDNCDRFFPAEIPRWTAWRDELEVQLGAGRNKELPVTILYAGMTITSTPIGRAKQDSNGTLQTCMGQLLALLQHDLPISQFAGAVVRRGHKVVELRQPASSTLDANLPRIGNVEVALIANLHISLNSAEGGRLIRVAALPKLETAVKRASATWPDLEQLAPSDAPSSFNASKTRQHFSEYLAYLKMLPAADVGQLVDGRARHDIGRCERWLLSTAYQWQRTLRAPSRKGHHSVRPQKRRDVHRARSRARSGTPSQTRHTHLEVSGCDPSDILRGCESVVLQPTPPRHHRHHLPCSGLVAKSLDTLTADTHQWLDQQIPSTKGLIKRLIRRGPNIAWRKTETERWIGVIGTVAVAQVGPDAIDTCLQVAMMDFGQIKYDPQVQDAAIAVGSAALAVAALARRVVLLRLRTGPIPTADLRKAWLRNAKRATDELVASTGLGAYLETARAEYLDVSQRLASLRGLGYYARHEAIVVAHGGFFADAAAHRSCLAKERIAKQEPGPVFVGEPLVTKEDRDLITSCFDSSSGQFQTRLIPPPALLRSARLRQLVEILDANAEAKLDGTISPAPSITIRPTRVKEWVEWFIKTREGVEMRRSAGGIDTGKGHGTTVEMRQRIKALRTSEAFVREENRRRARGTTLPLVGELTLTQAVKRMSEKFEKGAAAKVGRFKLEMCERCFCTFLHYSGIKNFLQHPCVDAKRVLLSPLFAATALLLTNSRPETTATTEYIKESGLQLVGDKVVRALPAVLVEQLESLSIHLPSSAQARLKQGAAIDGALVSLLSDFSLSLYKETLTEAETGACVPTFFFCASLC